MRLMAVLCLGPKHESIVEDRKEVEEEEEGEEDDPQDRPLEELPDKIDEILKVSVFGSFIVQRAEKV